MKDISFIHYRKININHMINVLKWVKKVKSPFLKKILGNINRHRWSFAPIIIGVEVGFSDGWSEW